MEENDRHGYVQPNCWLSQEARDFISKNHQDGESFDATVRRLMGMNEEFVVKGTITGHFKREQEN